MAGSRHACPTALVGRRILRVTASWHHFPGEESSVLHVWLHVDGLGPVRCHTGSSSVDLQGDQPHGLYDMDEYGHVTVEDAPADTLLGSLAGQVISGVAQVHDTAHGITIGFVLRLPTGDVRILNLGDELVVMADRAPGTHETEFSAGTK